MKKSILVIYVIMIAVGIIGLFFFANQSNTPVPQSRPQETPPQEVMTVAVARHDLNANSILQPDDYQIKNISVAAGSVDKRFNINQPNLNDWALNGSVSLGDYISSSILVTPGSDEYLAMFLQPGNVLYTFELDASDNYLLTNLKPGQGVDIYLSYSLKSRSDGVNEIVSPSHSISESRLKQLFLNKRILAVHRAESVKRNGVEYQEKGSLLVVELKDEEVKLLKGLEEGKAKIILFPSTQKPQNIDEVKTQKTSPVNTEDSWPVNNEPIFKFNTPHQTTTAEVNELRG